jgi:hypothetical protein
MVTPSTSRAAGRRLDRAGRPVAGLSFRAASMAAGAIASAGLASGAGAQQVLARLTPPDVLQVVVERIVPGGEARYDVVEKQLAELCKRRDCPNAYLALESFETPKEIYWLTAYRTPADVERIAAAYESNASLRAEMAELAAPKEELVEQPPETIMLRYREDASDGSPWLVGIVPYTVIAESGDAASSGGTVFETDGGRRLVFVPAANAEDANAIAPALGAGAKRFVLRTDWSKPAGAWIVANPALWSVR